MSGRNGSNLSEFCIIDGNGQPVGFLPVGNWESGLELQRVTTRSGFEFIALSLGTVTDVVDPTGETRALRIADTVGGWYEHLTYQDSEGTYMFPFPVVNMMLIHRRPAKVARRVAVGWIHLAFWAEASNQQFKVVVCLFRLMTCR